jgi:hypothetical protein
LGIAKVSKNESRRGRKPGRNLIRSAMKSDGPQHPSKRVIVETSYIPARCSRNFYLNIKILKDKKIHIYLILNYKFIKL